MRKRQRGSERGREKDTKRVRSDQKRIWKEMREKERREMMGNCSEFPQKVQLYYRWVVTIYIVTR
jgi:hypothetical protein